MRQTSAAAPAQAPLSAYVMLVIGLIAASSAAIFIRFAQMDGVPSLLIAAGRLTVAALILTLPTLARHREHIRQLSRADLLLAFASGAMLAIHFATWITSLEYVSVLISVVLVSTAPIWVAMLEVVFLRARLKALVLSGLVLVIVGGILIAGGGSDSAVGEAGRSPLLGGVLALGGAVSLAVYLVIGRRLRAQLPLLPYIWLVYGCAALVLIVVVVAAQIPVSGYSLRGYGMIVLLAVGPQLIGHSSFNYALGYLSATYVSITSQSETVASAVLAYLIFGERPLLLQIVGSAVVLTGVVLASYGQTRPSEAIEDAS